MARCNRREDLTADILPSYQSKSNEERRASSSLQKANVVQRLFCSEDLQRKTDPSESKIILYSRTRINLVVSLIITIVILTLLIIPVYLFWHLAHSSHFDNTTTAVMIGLLLVFTLVFSGTLSLFTRAKRHEILAAAAG
jgi:hypothetical protein